LSKTAKSATIDRFMRISLILFRFIAATTLAVPFSAHSQGAVPREPESFYGVLSAEDSIAGIGTEIAVQGFASNTVLSFTVHTPDGLSFPVQLKTDRNGEGIELLSGERTRKAGSYSVQRKDVQTFFEIFPDRVYAQNSSILSTRPFIDPNGQDTVEITVTIRDRYGNPLSRRPVELISSRSGDYVQLLSGETDASGTQKFTISTNEPGNIVLRAVDLLSGETIEGSAHITAGSQFTAAMPRGIDNLYGVGNNPFSHTPYPTQPSPRAQTRGRSMYYSTPWGQYTAQVSNGFDIIDHFEISAPDTLAAGVEAQKIIVRAVDRNGLTVENYTETILFSSSDPNAILPAFGSYTFAPRDLGQREFPLALQFQTPGEHVFRVEDETSSNVFGETVILVAGSSIIPIDRKIIIASHQDGQVINTTEITLEGKAPPFVNLLVTGGQTDVMGDTDNSGTFSMTILLNPNQRDFTIRIRDEQGQYDSGDLHLILDMSGPLVGNISFSPQEPAQGQNVLLVVESEPGLSKVTMTLSRPNGETDTLELREATTASGTYQLLFQAPSAGAYQPTIRAIDKAGNITDVRTTLTVGLPGLLKVYNVRAEPQKNAVALEWDAVPDDIDGYRIYVGEGPDDFLYHLDTGRPITKATVSGLLPGRIYYFSLTALMGDVESDEKSDVVSARVVGLTLDITEQDASLFVEWSSLPNNVPLDSFFLEYGTEPGKYTEKRNLHGELRAYILRDLLNGITYHLRLTPITVTGDILEDLAAMGQGMPQTLIPGFRPGPADPAPQFDLSGQETPTYRPPIGATTLERVPRAYPSGIPGQWSWIALGIAAIVIGFHLKRRRKLRSEAAILRSIQTRYR